jgi:oligopeptide transport system substrate-binding protein
MKKGNNLFINWYKFVFLASFVLTISSCSESSKPRAPYSGGEMSMALDTDVSQKNPQEITDFWSATVLYQIFEGLVYMDNESLEIKPQLVKSYNVSNDGLLYEFELREDVYFHPHALFKEKKDRLLTVDDVIYSIEKACSKNKEDLPSSAFLMVYRTCLKGAQEFYDGKSKSISGVKSNGSKFSLELIQPDANFLSKLATINAAIISKKIDLSNKSDEIIGTGPFILSSMNTEEDPLIRLTRNEDYYQFDSEGFSLPYLDKLNFIIEPSKLTQLEMFDTEKIQFIASLPSSKVTGVLEGRIADFNAVPPKLILRNNPMLATNYYFFNMTETRFQDIRVRKAFNYAINRDKITRQVLNGQYYENGIYGVVPPISSTFRKYPFGEIKSVGYDYDPEKARKLFAEAGFPEGKGFGTVTLKVNIGDIHTAVAEEIAAQLQKELGIIVNIDGMSFEQKRKDADVAKGDIFRTAWYADYKSPETFLQNFYGKFIPENRNDPSPMNQARYKNDAFDALYEAALGSKKVTEQNNYFQLAEKELLKDPPFIVLWYVGDNQLIYSKVRNFHENPLNYYIFKNVYFKDFTKEEYLERLKK